MCKDFEDFSGSVSYVQSGIKKQRELLRFISTSPSPASVFVCGCLCSQRGRRLSRWLINLPGILKSCDSWNTHVGLYAGVPEMNIKSAEVLSTALAGDCWCC